MRYRECHREVGNMKQGATHSQAWGRVPWTTEQTLWDTETWQSGCFWHALLDTKGKKAAKKVQKNIQSEIMGSVSELCVSSFQSFLCPTISRSPPGKSWLIFYGTVVIVNMFSIDSVVNATIITTCCYLNQPGLPLFNWWMRKNAEHEIRLSCKLGVGIF